MALNLVYQIPPRQIGGTDSTAYWEGFFTPDELDKIESLPHWSSCEKALVGGASEHLNVEMRRSDISWLELSDETQFIYEKISNIIATANSHFFHFDLSGIYEKIQLGIYDSSDAGFYNWHIDANLNTKDVPRKLSFAMLISDTSEFEGGELQVKDNSDIPKTLELKRGRAWLFPSYVLHRVTPVTKGTRKSLVVWAGGNSFK